jgi:hypothetical protein
VSRLDFKSENHKNRALARREANRISVLFASERNTKMIKTSTYPLLAAAFVALAGLAAPAIADDEANANFNEDAVLATLHQQGINASDLQGWNGKIRATVTLADGSTTFQYFDEDTLQPVGDNVATGSIRGERVARRVDSNYERPVAAPLASPTGNNSLTWVDTGDSE